MSSVYLGLLYARLDTCVNIVLSVGRYVVVTHANTSFLQIFHWDSFGALAPKPVEIPTIEMVEVVSDGVSRQKLGNFIRLECGIGQRWSRPTTRP